jgi:hypothetical protein
LLENSYKNRVDKKGKDIDLNMIDYFKIESSHKLSEYQVRVPTWSGSAGLRTPFLAWGTGSSNLVWYQTYNVTKHDRHTAFSQATLEHMLDAVCGCLIILTAQFQNQDFSGQPSLLSADDPHDGMDDAIGAYFRVKYPQNWPVSERYDFSWHILETDPDPFQQYRYP